MKTIILICIFISACGGNSETGVAWQTHADICENSGGMPVIDDQDGYQVVTCEMPESEGYCYAICKQTDNCPRVEC